jgi:tRNA(Ile)-lysidine synthase
VTELAARMREAARRAQLWRDSDRLLVALSGGPDSVTLLHLLHELAEAESLILAAAHVDFGLRGAQSAGDAEFCSDLCRSLEVPLHTFKAEPFAQGNVQDWARAERRRLLAECAASGGFSRVALGHTADDRAETFLLLLFRGAGPDALGSTLASSGLYIRPLVTVRRREILAYLAERRIPFRVDRTNLEGRYRRNRIRNELLPLAESIWSQDPVDLLNAQIDLLAMDASYVENAADPAFAAAERGPDRMRLATSVLAEYSPPLQLRALRRMARELGAEPSREQSLRLLELLHGTPGRQVDLGSGLAAEQGGGSVWIYRTRAAADAVPVNVPGETVLPDGSRLMAAAATDRPPFPDGRKSARIAMPTAGASWEVRPARAGDRMQPFGMKGTRLVMDLLSEEGVPRHARTHAWVLTSGGEIYWLLGVRLSELARVGPGAGQVYEFIWCAEAI